MRALLPMLETQLRSLNTQVQRLAAWCVTPPRSNLGLCLCLSLLLSWVFIYEAGPCAWMQWVLLGSSPTGLEIWQGPVQSDHRAVLFHPVLSCSLGSRLVAAARACASARQGCPAALARPRLLSRRRQGHNTTPPALKHHTS